MLRLFGLFSLTAFVSLASGCAMCCHPFDCDYLYQGGRWVRDIPNEGRVGSAFYNAGHRVDDEYVYDEASPEASVDTLPAPTNDSMMQPMPPAAPESNSMRAPDSRLVPSRPGNSVPYLPLPNN